MDVGSHFSISIGLLLSLVSPLLYSALPRAGPQAGINLILVGLMGKGFLKIMSFLIKLGANPALKDRLGNSSLHVLARSAPDHDEIGEYTEAVDVNTASNVGDTALHLAAEGGNHLATNILLSSGADPQRPNKAGETPLDVAKAIGDVTTEALIEEAADKKLSQSQILVDEDLDRVLKALKAGTCTVIDLKSHEIKKRDLIKLAELIRDNSSCESLTIANCGLGDAGASILAPAIRENRFLKFVDISNNQIGSSGCQALALTLSYNQAIAELVLDYNLIGDEGSAAILLGLMSNQTLNRLRLRKTGLSLSGLTQLPSLIYNNNWFQLLDLEENPVNRRTFKLFVDALQDRHSTCEVKLTLNDANPAELEKEMQQVLSENKNLAADIKRRAALTAAEQLQEQTVLLAKAKLTGELSLGHFEGGDFNFFAGKVYTDVTKVDIGSNRLQATPEGFCASLPNARELSIRENILLQVPRDISALKQLKILDLSSNNIKIIPPAIWGLVELETLDVRFNRIQYITSDCQKLVSLRRFYLDHNQLQNIPESLYNLPQLKHGSLTSNPIPIVLQSVFSAWASSAPSLDLSRQGLTDLPLQIGKVTSLTSLNVSGNNLSTLPPTIGSLVNLKRLDLRFNPMETLPWQLGACKGLANPTEPDFGLLYEKTKLEPFLDDLFDVKSLARLTGQDAKELDKKVKASLRDKKAAGKSQTEAILTLLEQCQVLKDHQKPSGHYKLMIVGNENVGKTTLFGALKNARRGGRRRATNSTSLDGSHALQAMLGGPIISTDGINIGEWEVKSNNTELKFSTWDFGGQGVYHGTHNFFLTDRALYLVLFNMLKPQDYPSIEYWCQSIRGHSPSSPIILVGTHADKMTPGDMELLQRWIQDQLGTKYPQIECFMPITTKEKSNIGVLQQQIIELVLGQEFVHQEFPQSFQAVDQALFSQRKLTVPPVIARETFYDVCKACGVAEAQRDPCLKYLTDVGSVLHYADPTSSLNDMVILDPQWLCSLLATLVTTKPNFVDKGIWPLDSMSFIWHPPNFPTSIHATLLSLLQKFELCFPISKQRQGMAPSFLIPCLLDTARPEIVWRLKKTQENSIRRYYKFDFKPMGMVARLMVRLNQVMTSDAYWFNGCLLTYKQSQVLLEWHDSQNTMRLESSGATSENAIEAFRVALDSIDLLFRAYYNFPHEVIAPCVCGAASGSLECGTTFLLEQLEELAAAHKDSIKCKNGVVTPIAKLAPDLTLADMKKFLVDIPTEVQKLEEIGHGGFGVVYRAKYKGKEVAMKLANVTDEKMSEVFDSFRRELWLTSSVQHPCIVELYGCSLNPCAVLMEMVTGGSLDQFIESKKEIGPKLMLKLSLNLAEAVRALHMRRPAIVHRDIKSPNILVVGPFNPNADVLCKLTDFGESRTLAGTLKGRENLGNPLWMAPEIMKDAEYDEKSDIYSVGIVMGAELLSRKTPFSEYEVSRSQFTYKLEDAILNELKRLVEDCWHQDPEQRPTAEVLVAELRAMLRPQVTPS